MNDKSVSWLHLSDFHFRSDQTYDSDVVLNALTRSLPDLFSRFCRPDFIVASGDIADTGQADQYEAASEFFDNLLSKASLDRSKLVVVPGNHDVDRKRGKGLSRSISAADADAYFEPSEPLPHIRERQFHYTEWYNSYFSGIHTFSQHSTCSEPITLSFGSKRIWLAPINSAAFSADERDHSNLWIGRRCLANLTIPSAADDLLRLAVMHHPLNWLNDAEESQIKGVLRSQFDCILRGHLHRNEVEQVIGTTGSAIHLAAGATYQTRKWPNTAMFVRWEGNSLYTIPIRYFDDPTEVWTLDPSLFPNGEGFQGKFDIPARASPVSVPEARPDASSESPSTDFGEDLFVTPSGVSLYAEPRLMNKSQEAGFIDTDDLKRITVDEIVTSDKSYLIDARSEYGGTELCKRLEAEIASLGKGRVYRKDARSLPSYRNKLNSVFADQRLQSEKATLIIDDLDLDRDERLMVTLSEAGWFSRVIAVSSNRGPKPVRVVDRSTTGFEFEFLHLWGVGRDEIRSMATELFQSQNAELISSVVDKVYDDLLALCIPLTPSNVIMYLRVLHKEEEFVPLNRVDIVGRYISESLRSSSDHRDGFNLKSKLEVVSAFIHKMHVDKRSNFEDRFWFEFCHSYQLRTLIEFDAKRLLEDLLSSRIAARWGGQIYIRYSFFFSYFLGRHMSSRPELIQAFMEGDDYLSAGSLVEVITGLSADNSAILDFLVNHLERYLDEFSSSYLKGDFDPLINARWPDSDAEDDALWEPISKQIEAGPQSPAQIDMLKTSMIAEARTSDQEVRFVKFAQLESALFYTGWLVNDALKNSDDVDGALKIRAYEAVLRMHRVAFQVGSVLSNLLAERKILSWGGITFIDFHRAATSMEPGSLEARLAVVEALAGAISQKCADEIGSTKLAPLFRARDAASQQNGFLEYMNFCALLHAKGPDWEQHLTKIIARTGKNSFYLWCQLHTLMGQVRTEVVQKRDREALKRLIAQIQSKRRWGKDVVGAKARRKMLNHLEGVDVFNPGKAGGEAGSR